MTRNFTALGPRGFSEGSADGLSLALSPIDGTPHVAYADAKKGFRATVMRFSGGSWSLLGPQGFTAGSVAFPRLAVGSDGVLRLAYQDLRSFQVSVMAYQPGSNSWSAVGPPASASAAYEVSMALDGSNAPWLAYTDGDDDLKVKVVRHDAGTNSWLPVGAAAASEGGAVFLSLVLQLGPGGAVTAALLGFSDFAHNAKVRRTCGRPPSLRTPC